MKFSQVAVVCAFAILISCSKNQSKDSREISGNALPENNSKNSTTCGGVTTFESNSLLPSICSSVSRVHSTGIDFILAATNPDDLSATSITISAVAWQSALQPNTPYEFVFKHRPDGRLDLPPDWKSFASAAITPNGDVLKRENLKGTISIATIPKNAGETYNIKFTLTSIDGTKSFAGEATGVVTESPFMKSDNN